MIMNAEESRAAPLLPAAESSAFPSIAGAVEGSIAVGMLVVGVSVVGVKIGGKSESPDVSSRHGNRVDGSVFVQAHF